MSKDKELTLEELAEAGLIGADSMARLLESSEFDFGRKYSRAELLSVVDRVSAVAGHSGTDSESPRDGEVFNEGLFYLYDPSTNVYFLTSMVGGRPQWSHDPSEGGFDLSRVIPSLKPLIEIIVRAGGNVEQARKMATTRITYRQDKNDNNETTQNKDDPTTKPKRRKEPGFIVDQNAVEWLIDNGRAAVFNHLDPYRKKSPKKPIKLEPSVAQAVIGIEGYRHCRKEGLVPMVQDANGFIQAHVKELKSERIVYVKELSVNPEIMALTSAFYTEFPGLDGTGRVLDLFRRPGEEGSVDSLDKMFEYSGEASYQLAKDVYRWVEEKVRNIDLDITPQKVIEALRNEIRSNPIMVQSIPREIQERVRECSVLWSRYAIAADDIAGNEYITERILPILATDKRASERQYQAVCEMGKLCLPPNPEISLTQYRYFILGLWMTDKLATKEMRKPGSVEVSRERSGKGAVVSYVDPISHLVQRFPTYDHLLMRSLDQLLVRGVDQLVESNVVSNKNVFEQLETQAQGRQLGTVLYDNLGVIDQRKFSHLKDPNRPLIRSRTSTHLVNILTYWAGMRREEILERVEASQGR